MVEITVEIDGEVDSNYINRSMTVLGELVINKIKDNIRDMDLIGKGFLLQGWISSWDGTKLFIENTKEYSLFIEYGTYGYWDIHGLETFTDPSDPKKKDLAKDQRSAFPKGMQAFAPMRRVIHNQNIMTDLVATAFQSQI